MASAEGRSRRVSLLGHLSKRFDCDSLWRSEGVKDNDPQVKYTYSAGQTCDAATNPLLMKINLCVISDRTERRPPMHLLSTSKYK